jgi:YD repeat-containing protein
MLLDQTYTRNARGMITATTAPDVGRSWVYGYDWLDRLISADNQNGTADDACPAPRKAARCVRGLKRSVGTFLSAAPPPLTL